MFHAVDDAGQRERRFGVVVDDRPIDRRRAHVLERHVSGGESV
jgi:hypothetical protein